ncbi:MAG: hypothetical protein JNL48_19585 [Acidobacteria bacterium]|nr:hypothetical protein [Acidobacteriota bacterium]
MKGRVIVVGGHSRGVGKTALSVALVRALAPRAVATVKVSAHRHGAGHLAIEEDTTPVLSTSTGRCLAAGAARAFLCRCPDARLHEVAVLVRLLASGGYDVVVESNRMAPLVDAALTLFVTSSATADWKASSDMCLARADAIVLAPGSIVPARARRVAAVHRRLLLPVLRFESSWGIPALPRWIDTLARGDWPRPAATMHALPAPA